MSDNLPKYIATVFVIVVLTVWWNESVVKTDQINGQANALSAITENAPVEKIKEFPYTELVGKSAIVYDFGSDEVLFSKSPNAQLPLASITKLMTVYSALTRLVPDAQITISQSAFETEGEFGLLVGDTWELSELARFTIVNSANDGAEAIGEAVTQKTGMEFISLMNQDATKLGMARTYFINASGLDESENLPSGYGSAGDVAKLLYASYYEFPNIFEATTHSEITARSLSGREYLSVNTNHDSEFTTGLKISKTGYTDIAGGNLAILVEVEPTRPVAIVVLGSTREDRFTDVQKLLNNLLVYLAE